LITAAILFVVLLLLASHWPESVLLTAPWKGQPPHNSWYGAAWQYRQKITVDGSNVDGTSPLENFPLLVSATLADWRSAGAGGKVGRSDGGDILFTAADGVSKLDHEVEAYSGTTGELVAWVRIPVLAAGADTELYMYYGNAAARAQQNRGGVWDPSYRGVWHLNESDPSSQGGADSTANGATGAPVGSIRAYAGKLGGAFDFTADGNYLSHGNPEALRLYGAMTASFWINPLNYTNTGAVIGKQSGEGARGWVVRLDSYGGINFNIAVDSNNIVSVYSAILPLDTWSYVTAVYEPGVALRLYVNGLPDGVQSDGVPPSQYDNGQSMLIGKRNGCDPCEIDGRLDEVRLQGAVRSQPWIAAEYRNQASPGSFYTIGGPMTATPISTPTHRPTATDTAAPAPPIQMFAPIVRTGARRRPG